MHSRRRSIRSIISTLAFASVAAACSGGSGDVAIPEATSAPAPMTEENDEAAPDDVDGRTGDGQTGDDVADDTDAPAPADGSDDDPVASASDDDSDEGDDDVNSTDGAVVTDAVAPTTTTSTTVAPATTAPPSDDTFLRIGDQGDAVALMQLKLRTLGYLEPGYATGQFDRATADALIDFQAQYGLVVDGIFGPETDRSLTAAAASVNPEG